MPKRLLAMLCICIFALTVVGCGQQSKVEQEERTVTLYLPDEQGEMVVPTKTQLIIKTDDEAGSLVDGLIANGVLPQGVSVNQLTKEDKNVTLDFNQAFADALSASGSTGEVMIMSAVADTFLTYYGASSLTITVDGKTIETGHTIYDEPFTYIIQAAPVE